MKKSLIGFSALVLMLGALSAQAEVHFKDLSFKDAQAQAKKEHKIIMIDYYTNWCRWCKQLDKDVYAKDEVGFYADSNIVSLKLNAEQGEGVTLARDSKIMGYPTIIFYNENGEEIHRQVGYQVAKDFLVTLHTAVSKNKHAN